jgi:hypothetical protein
MKKVPILRGWERFCPLPVFIGLRLRKGSISQLRVCVENRGRTVAAQQTGYTSLLALPTDLPTSEPPLPVGRLWIVG